MLTLPASVLWAHGALVAFVAAYALLKERAEMGCAGFSFSSRQCADESSVYVSGTAPQPGDGCGTLRRRVRKALAAHEQGGVWKRCFVVATALAYLAYLAQRGTRSPAWAAAAFQLSAFALLYLWMQFTTYHTSRMLQRNGNACLAAMRGACGAAAGGRRW